MNSISLAPRFCLMFLSLNKSVVSYFRESVNKNTDEENSKKIKPKETCHQFSPSAEMWNDHFNLHFFECKKSGEGQLQHQSLPTPVGRRLLQWSVLGGYHFLFSHIPGPHVRARTETFFNEHVPLDSDSREENTYNENTRIQSEL